MISDASKVPKYPKINIMDKDAATADNIAEKAAKLSAANFNKL
jgi:hypothetical protein